MPFDDTPRRTSTSSDLDLTIDTYLAALTEADRRHRESLIAKAFVEYGRLIDPPCAATGWRGISAMSGALRVQFPRYSFRRASDVEERAGRARFGWEFVAPDGTAAVAGVDHAELSADGRFQCVVRHYGAQAPASNRPRRRPTTGRRGPAYFLGRPAEQWREAMERGGRPRAA